MSPPLLTHLQTLLAAHPAGLREYELFRLLRQQSFTAFPVDGFEDPLMLFQGHFMLFHLLYTLRDQLRARGEGDVAIHCLRIALLPPRATSATLPDDHDPLRDYYLDLNHLEQTDRAGVEAMLDQFWRDFQRREQRQEALAVLGLSDPVSAGEIKSRYRELAKRHHPDHGGLAEGFHKLAWAMEQL